MVWLGAFGVVVGMVICAEDFRKGPMRAKRYVVLLVGWFWGGDGRLSDCGHFLLVFCRVGGLSGRDGVGFGDTARELGGLGHSSFQIPGVGHGGSGIRGGVCSSISVVSENACSCAFVLEKERSNRSRRPLCISRLFWSKVNSVVLWTMFVGPPSGGRSSMV